MFELLKDFIAGLLALSIIFVIILIFHSLRNTMVIQNIILTMLFIALCCIIGGKIND